MFRLRRCLRSTWRGFFGSLWSLRMTVLVCHFERSEKSLCHAEPAEKSRPFDASQHMLGYRIANKIVNAYVMHGCSFSPAKTLRYFNYSNYFSITMFSWWVLLLVAREDDEILRLPLVAQNDRLWLLVKGNFHNLQLAKIRQIFTIDKVF